MPIQRGQLVLVPGQCYAIAIEDERSDHTVTVRRADGLTASYQNCLVTSVGITVDGPADPPASFADVLMPDWTALQVAVNLADADSCYPRRLR